MKTTLHHINRDQFPDCQCINTLFLCWILQNINTPRQIWCHWQDWPELSHEPCQASSTAALSCGFHLYQAEYEYHIWSSCVVCFGYSWASSIASYPFLTVRLNLSGEYSSCTSSAVRSCSPLLHASGSHTWHNTAQHVWHLKQNALHHKLSF